MTTPTGPIKLSDVQTEFGGANPISLSEYYKGGAYVSSSTATSATDGTAIPTSGTIRLGEFRGVSAAAVTSSLSLTASHTRVSTSGGGSSTANIELLSDGTTAQIGASTVAGTNWFAPTTTGIDANYWFKLNVTSGAVGGSGNLADGTWVQGTSSSVQSLSVTATTTTLSGTDIKSCAGTIQIAATNGGTVLGTVTFSVHAEMDSGA